MNISRETVYLWFTFLEDIQDEKLLAEYRCLLPEKEQQKLERYRFDNHKKRYLVGRALIRSILSRCTGVPPDLIIFAREAHGRPYLKHCGQKPPLQFNLSYTEGLVAFALVSEKRVGIDVEYISAEFDFLEIADKHFSASEIKELTQLPLPLLKDRFYQYWTLKEAYLKARGLGLNAPLDKVSFALGNNNSVRMNRTSITMTDDGDWHLRIVKPGPEHTAAICVSQNTVSPIVMEIKKATPLVTEEDLNICAD